MKNDTTIIMPTHNRAAFFEHYQQEGFWDDLPLLVFDDGSDVAELARYRRTAEVVGAVVQARTPNQGVANAMRSSVAYIHTPYYLFVGDDDFLVDMPAFFHEAASLWAQDDTLLVAMPRLYAFSPQAELFLQYDRSMFDGMTGRALLRYLVTTGEMQAMGAGVIFRKADMEGKFGEDVFQVSSDYVSLARLCGHHPDRVVRVATQGHYMRLLHDQSLTARPRFTVKKAMLNQISMMVGAWYLLRQGEMTLAELARLLLERGTVVQQAYGKGKHAAAVLVSLLLEKELPRVSTEMQEALMFLREHLAALPPEFLALIGEAGVRQLWASASVGDRTDAAQSTSVEEAPTVVVARPSGPRPRYLFVGGGARTGTTLAQMILCQAEATNPMVPEAHSLRCFLSAFHLAAGSATHQIPQYFDDLADFRQFHAGQLRQYLDRTRARFGEVETLVLKDPEMTRFFPDLMSLLPEAHFVVMVRDPRDVVASLLAVGRKLLDQQQGGLLAEAARTRNIRALCHHFKAFYAPVLACPDEVLWAQTLFVRYEDLVQDTEAILGNLSEFTGLNLAGLNPYTDFNTGHVHYADRKESPYFSALYGKGITDTRIGTFTEVLTDAEVQAVESVCREFLDLFQYAPHPQRQAA
jgi:hypothetical protein